jgi:transposase InsO family protein
MVSSLDLLVKENPVKKRHNEEQIIRILREAEKNEIPLRDECLNVHWFESIDDAKAKIEAWRHEYNESRLHQALQEQTPADYARRAKTLEPQLEHQSAGN